MTPEEALSGLCSLTTVIHNKALFRICYLVLDDSNFRMGFGAKVGTSHAHHAYKGGLVVHTYEVATIALDIARNDYLDADIDVLITAAILHDYRKISDYDLEGNSTQYRELVKHVAGSHADFVRWAYDENLDDNNLSMKIQHCLLAHHGRLEWGSAVEPKIVEAAILHYADMLSMAYGAGRTSV